MNRKQRRAVAKHGETSRNPSAGTAAIPMDIAELLGEGRKHLQAGRLSAAEACYRRVLAAQPEHPDALHLLGIIAHHMRRHDVAITLIGRAIKQNGQNPFYFSNLGNALQDQGRRDEAIAAYRQATAIKPDYAEAYSNLGNALRNHGKRDEAIAACRQAIAIKPAFAEAHYNLGAALQDLRHLDQAIAAYRQAIATKPDFAAAHCNLGAALREKGSLAEAITAYRQAIRIKPDFAEAHSNLAIALQDQRKLDEAIAALRQAIGIRPDFAEAHYNLGNALRDHGKLDEAIAAYRQAVAINPGYAEAHSNLGNALRNQGKIDEALNSYDRAIQLKPDIECLMGVLLHTKMKICDWSGYGSSVAALHDRIASEEKLEIPFHVLALPSSRELQRKVSEIWISAKSPASGELGEISKLPQHERIRVGYFSPHFHNHPGALLMAELFEKQDRSKFELIAFSLGPDTGDDMRRRLKAAFDKFIDVRNMSDRDVALLARSLEIDIGVDRDGFTDGARTSIFAMRVAPIQVNYLGYPGTMGADYIDYLIADSTLIPTSHQPHYAEKIVYLPNSYQPNDRKRQISDRLFTRSELGLPQEGFVFCCFNNNYKIIPDTFDSWMRILGQIDGSVLWLLGGSQTVSKNLRHEARARGIDPGRLVFAPRIKLPDHLARHRMADLFLDTLPYNAHTTASDALWTGLPVLTQIGETFAARVAASLLNALHLPELVTTTREAYEALAVELATNPAKLASLKRKLADNRLTAPLFDTELFTKHIEAAYTAMYERYHADFPPDHIYVPK